MTHVMSDGENIVVECPNCASFSIVSPGKSVEELSDDSTCNCCNCGSLLLIRMECVYDFHEYLSRGSNWPKDGKGTGFVRL